MVAGAPNDNQSQVERPLEHIKVTLKMAQPEAAAEEGASTNERLVGLEELGGVEGCHMAAVNTMPPKVNGRKSKRALRGERPSYIELAGKRARSETRHGSKRQCFGDTS